MSIKVAIVEDNAGVRDHWTRLIDGTPEHQCVCACERAETALQQLPLRQPDVILMDINLPGMSGIECTARLHQALPKARIVIVTVYNDSNSIFRALQAGASGYLLKRVTGEELIKSIDEVMDGGVPMTGEIARKVIESFQRPTSSPEQDTQLTPRESEVLAWLARGFTSKEIADRLGISSPTVSLHLHHIYAKLHVRSRTEAAAKYFGSNGMNAR
jgi:DNA-binding NarL/FixJ family response regulator